MLRKEESKAKSTDVENSERNTENPETTSNEAIISKVLAEPKLRAAVIARLKKGKNSEGNEADKGSTETQI